MSDRDEVRKYPLALYGLVGFLRDGTHVVPLVLGLLVTAACILILANPSR